jgi:hypothetical protein
MKRLKFEELWLLSTKEKKARAESLSNEVTAVVADNEFGKSSLVKSLYATLGAEPTKIPEAWTQAQVSSLLKFSIDGITYFMLRYGPIFVLFDEGKNKIWSATGITKGLAPKIAPMLDFNIELLTKSGEAASPIPAFCFMPFYIDQDKGWSEIWESFSGTGFVPNYKNDIANFHTGIRPKEYYAAKTIKAEASVELSSLRQDRSALNRAEARIKDKRSSIGIAFDPESFADRIESLLKEQNALQALFDAAKLKVSDLQSLRAMAFEEMDIAKKVLSELEADVKFIEKVEETEIHCPICNTVHKNDFSNRYGLMNDADACRAVYSESMKRVAELEISIQKEMRQVYGVQDRIAKINELLGESRGEIKLRDMLHDESERMVDHAFVVEGAEIDGQIGEVDRRISAADARMKEFDKAKHKKMVKDFYVERMLTFCKELGVTKIPDAALKSIRPTISEAGSSQPRLFLAYYYAILHTIAKFSTACFGPIVVDTPKQQDQDEKNAEAMIKFCIERRPIGTQLILASGSLHGVDVPGRTINPGIKSSLLDAAQFDAVRAFMTPFIDAAMD